MYHLAKLWQIIPEWEMCTKHTHMGFCARQYVWKSWSFCFFWITFRVMRIFLSWPFATSGGREPCSEWPDWPRGQRKKEVVMHWNISRRKVRGKKTLKWFISCKWEKLMTYWGCSDSLCFLNWLKFGFHVVHCKSCFYLFFKETSRNLTAFLLNNATSWKWDNKWLKN